MPSVILIISVGLRAMHISMKLVYNYINRTKMMYFNPKLILTNQECLKIVTIFEFSAIYLCIFGKFIYRTIHRLV